MNRMSPLNPRGGRIMRWRLLVICVAGMATLSVWSAPAPTPAEPRLELRLAITKPKDDLKKRLTYEVTIVNRGKTSETLVQPGDGSDCGWRTPIVEWVIDGEVPGARGLIES